MAAVDREAISTTTPGVHCGQVSHATCGPFSFFAEEHLAFGREGRLLVLFPILRSASIHARSFLAPALLFLRLLVGRGPTVRLQLLRVSQVIRHSCFPRGARCPVLLPGHPGRELGVQRPHASRVVRFFRCAVLVPHRMDGRHGRPLDGKSSAGDGPRPRWGHGMTTHHPSPHMEWM
eukprot:scaffold1440_cov332-Pavlova_lutheri.AAC.58